ncbi:hypothetical protein J3R83DRAFT_13332 [Lanmaoa asiatica]|nr:hypothetical protein J3R83DRAFT_13332 [Lanmaoa asiatica]
MGITQTQETEEDHDGLLPDNPFVPPKGDVCFINNLPPELLSHIFEIGADNEEADDNDSDVDMTEELDDDEEETDDEGGSDVTGSSDFSAPWPPFPVVVSHVCRHWRNIAFSTPSLWTTIVVPPEARPPYEPVSLLLERSKGVPIDIYISCDPDEHEVDCDATDNGAPSEADLKFLYSLLIPHVHRWRTIEVSVSDYRHMYVFLSAVSDPSISAAPQLTTLRLYHHEEKEEFDNFGRPSISKHFILFGGSAPCLTGIVLWGVHVDWDQPWIASASKLTDLELAYHSEDVRPSWAQFATILRGASSLEKLSLPMSGPSGGPQGWLIEPTPGSPRDLDTPVQLLKVTDFVLAFHSPLRAIGLLRKLYLPALKNLVIDFDNGDYTEFVHELAGPATSISPPSAREPPRSLLSNLESLKIAGLPCRAECVETLYAELQNLTLLNISLSYLPQLFLDILCTTCMFPGRGDIWLPRLVTLEVSGTSGDALREVVRNRREAGVPLESLYVDKLSCALDKEDGEWLKENLKTFEFFEGSDDEDVIDFEDLHEEVDEWSDMD